ncbi:MAG TPA: MBL fold metallo-hydrolase [Thermodesulfobacteriota bacterium]|nr:MBL fold metallo-hydrolase [Thermodesulfobacteriota bacterium]
MIYSLKQLGFPPADDQIEITVFGPGYGESIVVYIPGLGWGVIDSCRYEFKNTTYILPLEYLKAYNVTSLCFVILTHPHADHYRGMGEILRHFDSSIKRICRYSGKGIREFKTYLTELESQKGDRQGDIRELMKLFKLMGYLQNEKGVKLRRLSELTEIIPAKNVSLKNHSKVRVRLISLSPSSASEEEYERLLDQTTVKAIVEGDLARLLDLNDRRHNLIASALLLEIGTIQIVLGSDLERGDSNQTGWKGVCSNVDCPNLSAHMVKVPHHGSHAAHYDQAWNAHSSSGRLVSVVSPYNKSSPPLPRISDINRIKKYCIQVGLTSYSGLRRADEAYSREVRRAIGNNIRKSWLISSGKSRPGFARIRFNLGGEIVEQKAIPPAKWISGYI